MHQVERYQADDGDCASQAFSPPGDNHSSYTFDVGEFSRLAARHTTCGHEQRLPDKHS
jgi:hypothetical protein